MSLSCYETVDRHPRGEGTDYGATGFIIILHGTFRVVWRPGSTIWAGIGRTAYSPACLQAEDITRRRGATEFLSGGRLSEERWFSVRKKLAEFLEVPIDEIPQLLPDRTVTIP